MGDLKMNIELIKATKEHGDLLFNHSITLNDNSYIIKYNNELCGLIEYHTPYEYSLKIEYICVFPEYTRQKIATNTISYLKSIYSDHEIYGDSLPMPATVSFWESVGAEFEEDDFETFYKNKECIPFIIY